MTTRHAHSPADASRPRQIAAAALAAAGLLLGGQAGAQDSTPPPLPGGPQPGHYHFLMITGDLSETAILGAKQGIAEANLQGRFLGKQYHLAVYPEGDLSFEAIKKSDYVAVLTTLHGEMPWMARRFSERPVFNLTDKDLRLRRACHPNLLHIIPSEKMYADARRQWRQKHPGAETRVSAWHPDFVKFAARDLNKRYRKAFDRPMDEYAWAGWAAIKMTSDYLARAADDDPPTPQAILRFLKTDLAFDGQKGLSMTFRPTGQLRQILLVTDKAGKLLGEAPVRGVVPADDVDSLGLLECE